MLNSLYFKSFMFNLRSTLAPAQYNNTLKFIYNDPCLHFVRKLSFLAFKLDTGLRFKSAFLYGSAYRFSRTLSIFSPSKRQTQSSEVTSLLANHWMAPSILLAEVSSKDIPSLKANKSISKNFLQAPVNLFTVAKGKILKDISFNLSLNSAFGLQRKSRHVNWKETLVQHQAIDALHTSRGFDLVVNFLMKHNRKSCLQRQLVKALFVLRESLENALLRQSVDSKVNFNNLMMHKGVKTSRIIKNFLCSSSKIRRQLVRKWLLLADNSLKTQYLFVLYKAKARNLFRKGSRPSKSVALAKLLLRRRSLLYYLYVILRLVEWPLRLYYNRIGARIVEFTRMLAPGWGLTPSMLRLVDEVRSSSQSKVPLHQKIAVILHSILLKQHEIYKDALSVRLKARPKFLAPNKRDLSRRITLSHVNAEISSRWSVLSKRRVPSVKLGI